jgi:hypothetical protein
MDQQPRIAQILQLRASASFWFKVSCFKLGAKIDAAALSFGLRFSTLNLEPKTLNSRSMPVAGPSPPNFILQPLAFSLRS